MLGLFERRICDLPRAADGIPEGLRLARHKGGEVHSLPRQLAGQCAEYALQLWPLSVILGEHPGFGVLDCLVGPGDGLEDRFHRLVNEEALRAVEGAAGRGVVGAVGFVCWAEVSCRDHALAVLLDHRDGAAGEVAESVGEFGGVDRFESLPRERSVAVERDLAQQEVPEGINAKAVDRIGELELYAGALGEPFPPKGDEPVRPDALREGKVGGEEHCWPDHRVEAGDVLAHDVHAGRPARPRFREELRGPVVGECVEPHIGGLHFAVGEGAREGDAPIEARAAGGDILEAVVEECQYLIAPRLGLEELRMRSEVRLERLGVAREPKEPVALGDIFEGARGVERAVLVHDVRGLLEAFATDAVAPRVGALVKVVRVVREDSFEQVLHRGVVFGGGSAHELVVRNLQTTPHRAKVFSDSIHELARGEPSVFCSLRDLVAVLVHPDQEPDVVAHLAAEAADGVGADLLEGVAQMRLAVGVVDGGGEVEARHGD